MPVIIALAAAAFLSTIVMRMLDPIVPLAAADLAVTTSDVALLSTAYALPYGLFQLIWGPLGDRYGKVHVARFAVIGLGLTIIATALAPTYTSMLAARFVSGAIGGAIIPLGLATIGDRIALDRRQAFLSRFMLAVILGSMIGGFLTGVLADYVAWRMVLLGYGLTTLAIGIGLSAVRLVDHGKPDIDLSPFGLTRRYGSILARPRPAVLLAIVFTEGLLVFGIIPFLAPYLHGERGASFGAIGVIIAGFGLGGVLFSLLVSLILPRVGPYGGIGLGGALIAAATLAYPFAFPIAVYGVLWMLAGFGFYMMHNALQVRATEMAPDARGSAFSLFAFSFFAGQGVGPVVGGVLAPTIGYAPTIATMGGSMLLLGLLAARQIRASEHRR
jgi:predicted MFS family arabinose efflux permease